MAETSEYYSGRSTRAQHSAKRIRVQRAANGRFLGACLAISVDDLSFVRPGIEWLAVEKRTDENAIYLKITGQKPDVAAVVVEVVGGDR